MCGIGSGWPGKLLTSSSAGMNIPYIMQHGSIANKAWLKKSVSFSFTCCELGGSGPFGFVTQGLLVQTLWLCYLWPIAWCLILRQQFPMQVTHQSDNKGLHCINQKTGGGRSTASQYHNINWYCWGIIWLQVDIEYLRNKEAVLVMTEGSGCFWNWIVNWGLIKHNVLGVLGQEWYMPSFSCFL